MQGGGAQDATAEPTPIADRAQDGEFDAGDFVVDDADPPEDQQPTTS